MTNAQPGCEFFLLRYVPDLLKNEHVNFGVVVLDPARLDEGFAEVRFTRDWRRVRCLDPGADLEMLQELEADLRRRLRNARDREEMLRIIEQFSNTIQISPTQACLTSFPEQEIERLAQEYLEPAPRKAERSAKVSARMAIYRPMRSAFEQAGVWELMDKNISVAPYTYSGDPLKLDCGYRPNGALKLFHAVSLTAEIESAKLLAFSSPRIVEGIRRAQKVDARLTAVIEDDLDRASGSVAFALEAFAKSEIATATVSQLPQLAEIARKELWV